MRGFHCELRKSPFTAAVLLTERSNQHTSIGVTWAVPALDFTLRLQTNYKQRLREFQREHLEHAAYIGGTMVSREYQGRGYVALLNRYMIEVLRTAGYRYVHRDSMNVDRQLLDGTVRKSLSQILQVIYRDALMSGLTGLQPLSPNQEFLVMDLEKC